jgi:hypothetical protein
LSVLTPLALIVSLAAPATAMAAVPFDENIPRADDYAPGFSLEALGGETRSLKDGLRRGPVVVVFGSFT